jgi:Carboxypeptidase regulatory-like domain
MMAILIALIAPAAANACPDVNKQILSGTVTKDGGDPIAYVKVKILQGDTVVAETKTNWKGQYRVYLPTGEYRVFFTKYGYEQGFGEIAVAAPGATLDMTLVRAK